jgi:hypothetical protein
MSTDIPIVLTEPPMIPITINYTNNLTNLPTPPVTYPIYNELQVGRRTPSPPLPDLPSSPDFSFASSEKPELLSAYTVIQRAEAWHLLRDFRGESFMWSSDPQITGLMNKIANAYGGHSGASLACTMRCMEFIARHGFASFQARYIQ